MLNWRCIFVNTLLACRVEHKVHQAQPRETSSSLCLLLAIVSCMPGHLCLLNCPHIWCRLRLISLTTRLSIQTAQISALLVPSCSHSCWMCHTHTQPPLPLCKSSRMVQTLALHILERFEHSECLWCHSALRWLRTNIERNCHLAYGTLYSSLHDNWCQRNGFFQRFPVPVYY
jgi:hypothetical protein